MTNKEKKAKETTKKKAKKETVKRYSKEQLLQSKKFMNRKVLLQTLLEDEKTYSIQEVEKTINKFMKRKVEN